MGTYESISDAVNYSRSHHHGFPTEPTSISPATDKVPLGGPTSHAAHIITNTSGDAERIKANGLACLSRLHGDLTWDDWLGVGAALEIITAEAQVEVGAQWDPDNKRLVKAFNIRWEEYEAAGTNHKPLSKQERSALREIMSNPEISAWRGTLTDPDKRRLNYPKAVLRGFKAHAKAKAIPAKDKPPSPYAKLEATNVKLQEDLHRLTKNGDGNAFTRNDSTKAIATAIIGTFDGLGNKTSKVEAIARELRAWVKQQKKQAEAPHGQA